MAPRSPAAKAENEARMRAVRRRAVVPAKPKPLARKAPAASPARKGIVERRRPAVTEKPTAKKAKAARRPPVASKAGRVLGDNGSTSDERAVAGSVLATSDDREKQQEVVATLEAANRSLQEENGRLQEQWEKSEALCRKLEDDFHEMTKKDANHYLTEDKLRSERDEAKAEVVQLNAKVETLTAQLEVAKSTDLAAEVERLKEQLRWRDEQASTRRP